MENIFNLIDIKTKIDGFHLYESWLNIICYLETFILLVLAILMYN